MSPSWVLRSQQKASDPLELGLKSRVNLSVDAGELNTGPLQEQPVLFTTKVSLQPLCQILKIGNVEIHFCQVYKELKTTPLILTLLAYTRFY